MVTRVNGHAEIDLSLDAAAQVSGAAKLAEYLRSILAEKALLVCLDLSALTQVDVTFFQILFAFNDSLGRQGRHLVVKSLPSDHAVLQTAALLGIELERFMPIARADK